MTREQPGTGRRFGHPLPPASASTTPPLPTIPAIRKRATSELFGLPLWEIAIGPDPQRGESRGHARAILALGDLATGFIAIGGLARGGIAIGGLALGIIAFGGAALGALAVGGLGVGGVALGGLAVGIVAVGGLAIGHYALGGVALGTHTWSGLSRSPAAEKFFRRWWSGALDAPDALTINSRMD